MKNVDIKNNNELIIVNNNADLGPIVPFGISLNLDVLGFFLSISLSIYLLNAMAADLAKIIHSITRNNIFHEK